VALSPRMTERRPSREDVLARAEALLEAEGPAALTMRRLAKDLGTSYQVIYSRIGDKGALVRALHEEGFRRLRRSPTSYHPDGEDEVLLGLARYYRLWATENPALFDLMFGAPIAEFVRDDAARRVEWEGFRDTFVAACRAWLDAKLEARPKGASVRLAWRIWTAVHGITVLHLAGHPSPSGDVDDDLNAVVRRLLRDPLD